MTASVKPAKAQQAAPFELKSAAINLIAFAPRTADLAELDAALKKLSAGEGNFFGGDAALIDLADWPASATPLDLSGLLDMLRSAGLNPLGTRGGNAESQAAARANGMILLPPAREISRAAPAAAPEVAAKEEDAGPATSEVEPAGIIDAPQAPASCAALIVDKPVRSGQQIYARGRDLVVMALVSHGAEVIADGNIHVYASLRGRALAGARGNTAARIITQSMEAELLSIAGIYRSIDEALPSSIARKAAQVRLDGNKLVIEALG